jgi:hypothetical protein
MKQSALIFGVLILLTATVLGAVVQGRLTHRWGKPAESERLAARLQELPAEIGPWHARGSQPLGTTAEAMLECAGYVGRQYENSETAEVVTLAVLLGPAGPISVHTPDVCYSSQDYDIRRSPEQTKLDHGDGRQNEFWCTTLQSTGLDAHFLRVYFGWSTGGLWSAPADARFAFAGKPYLYKIQVAGVLTSPDNPDGSDPALNFLKSSLPVIEKYLVEPIKE